MHIYLQLNILNLQKKIQRNNDMFNKSKVRKVNELLDVAENCLNNKDREND